MQLVIEQVPLYGSKRQDEARGVQGEFNCVSRKRRERR